MGNKKKVSIPLIVFSVVIVAIVLFFLLKPSYSTSIEETQETTSQISDQGTSIMEEAWIDVELKDISTQQTFKVSDFIGKPILVESFAVWCPTCTSQQKKVRDLHNDIGDGVVSISLDTDPNEDESRVKEHLDRNGFDWYYAIAPIELTKALIDDFGVGIVNAPSAPLILICEDGTARKLRNGVKAASELKEEIRKCP